jgi:hypothetical protein
VILHQLIEEIRLAFHIPAHRFFPPWADNGNGRSAFFRFPAAGLALQRNANKFQYDAGNKQYHASPYFGGQEHQQAAQDHQKHSQWSSQTGI